MALPSSSTLPKLCIGSMDAVCAAPLARPIAKEKSRSQTIPNHRPEMPFCQARQPWLELMGLLFRLGAENGRSL